MIQYVLFDLDDTLYPPSAGIMNVVSQRIQDYVVSYTNLTRDEAESLQRKYYLQFGSSLQPLAQHFRFDLAHFVTFAHDVDIELLLKPDDDLDCLIGCVQAKLAIFTNGPRTYATRVLRRLGIEHRFIHVFDSEFSDYLIKPNPACYLKVETVLGESGSAILMVDDVEANLVSARRLGWHTIRVQADKQHAGSSAEFAVHDLWQIADALHQLGVMDDAHRTIAEHRLGTCPWAKRASLQ